MVAVLCPDEPDLLGLVAEVAPPLAAGNTVVALVSERRPIPSLDAGEVAAVSDVRAGTAEPRLGPPRGASAAPCGHRDVNAVADATGDPDLGRRVVELAAESV